MGGEGCWVVGRGVVVRISGYVGGFFLGGGGIFCLVPSFDL